MIESTSDFQTKPAEMPIKMYKNVHTGPNIQLGGLKKGFSREVYHPVIELDVPYPEIAPTKTQMAITMGILNLLEIFMILFYQLMKVINKKFPN